MRMVNNSTAKLGVAAALLLGGLSLSACATPNYDDDIAALNSRVTAVEGAVNSASAAAQAAAADARNANARIDALTARVDSLEQRSVVTRTPRN